MTTFSGWRRHSLWVVACSIAILAPSAAADGPHADRVEVTGHYDNGIETSDTASQGYITPKLIEARPLLRPAEVLEYVPGVIVTQHSGDGKANQFFLRGFNLDHGTDFHTTVAGVPVNMPSHAHGQGYSDLNFLIPELISRIDYRKGPYFAADGDFSSAGAAHFHYVDTLKQGIAAAILGSFNYRRTVLAGAPGLGPGMLLYGLELATNDGPWQNPARYAKQNAVLRYSMREEGRSHSLTAMAYQGRWNATDQIPLRGAGTLGRFGAVDASDGGDSQRYSLSYEHRRPLPHGDFHFAAYALRYRLQLFSNFTYFMNDPLNGDQFEQADRRSVYGIAPTWTWNGHWGERESVLRGGFNLRRDNIGRVGLYRAVLRQRLATVREDAVQQSGYAGWIEHALQWNAWMRSVVGARADFFSADVHSDLQANSGRTRDQIASPKLNLILGPFAKTEYFFSYGNGFHSNDARGTTIRVDPADRSTPVAPVPALVRSHGAELGVRSEAVDNLQSSLALWRLGLDSELLFVGDAGNTTATRPSLRHGVEWSNRYRPRSWLTLDADASISRARFTGFDPAGERVPGSIDRVLSLGAAIDSLGPWSGALQLRYFGPRPLLADASERSSSTLLWNARAGYRLDRNSKLTLDLLNLLNRQAGDIDYFYLSQLRGEPAPVSDRHFHPVEPRSVRFTLTANF